MCLPCCFSFKKVAPEPRPAHIVVNVYASSPTLHSRVESASLDRIAPLVTPPTPVIKGLSSKVKLSSLDLNRADSHPKNSGKRIRRGLPLSASGIMVQVPSKKS